MWFGVFKKKLALFVSGNQVKEQLRLRIQKRCGAGPFKACGGEAEEWE